MVCLRNIMAASAALLIGIGTAAAETGAESAPGGVPGRPISLTPPAQSVAVTAKKPPHIKSAAKVAKKTEKPAHRKFAAARPVHVAMHDVAIHDTAAASSPSAWPALSPMPAADAAPATEPAAPASAFPANPPTDAQLREMVINGQTVGISPPDDVNELDLAATKTADASAAAKSDASAPAQTVAAAQASDDGSPISNRSWYMQAFAALGGALAAGAIAWFLMGSAPHRMYG
jgi:hypothetical protein